MLPSAVLQFRHPARALFVAWLTALLPSMALSAVVTGLLPRTAQPDFALSGWIGFFAVVIFSPVVETLIMGGVLALLLRFVSPTAAVLLSAAGWGLAHSALAPGWGLVIWWPFLVFSTLFVVWREHSLLAALAMPAGAHALQTLLPALLLLAGR